LDKGGALVPLDRENSDLLSAAIHGGCDLLIDTIAFDAEHARQLLEVQNDVGQFAAISSASVYCDDEGRTLDEARQNGFPELPDRMTEEQSTVEPGPQTYSTRKVSMERELLENATIPTTILRPCAIHGPYSTHPREWWFVKRILDGREFIPIAFGGRSIFQTSAASNIAALVSAIVGSQSHGVFNAADPRPPNVLDIGEAVLANCNSMASLLPVEDHTYPAVIGATPWSVPKPFTVSDAKGRAIGYRPVGNYSVTVTETCSWLIGQPPEGWKSCFTKLAMYPYDMFDYAAEDRWLESFKIEV
jgi:nucleoside-diphosphate-sugar epimerase